ncbi:unnamed protein product [Kuraishia capsulata CBS 1993]|uniref:Mitochondrial intermembrane space import and assembly protein 40 n=1 Tax=Kuraishia capsulata CBS 1993 TaxID=1382522 RepID=W6MG46_9ASCO|nr:uncharacterized protein KUCA_T00000662001 [Kuraishia capsulata CBS 1993]CDK24696.1 unnamed protein product [Kuraishia capsulata CBS 1993]
MFVRSLVRSARLTSSGARLASRQYSSFTTTGARSSKLFLVAPVATVGALSAYYLATPVYADSEAKEEPVVEQQAESADPPAQGAYNPETGEINWDCPCLGGMADGPCGEEFKAAFSCFVYSEADPKGYDCIDKFKGMQECFRKHPEVYSEELRDDDDFSLEPSSEEPAPASGEVVEVITETVDVISESAPAATEIVSETVSETVSEVVPAVSDSITEITETIVEKVNDK